MTGPNDFFVRFDSNAKAWAGELVNELAPAKAEIARMQGMLRVLEKQAESTGGKLAQPLAAGAGKSLGGQAESRAFVDNINTASDELKHMIGELGRALKSIKEMPALVANARRGVATGERHANGSLVAPSFVPGQSGFAKAGTPGAIQTGSFEHQVLAAVRQAAKGGALAPGAIGGRYTPAPVSIASVGRGDIAHAAADRIVKAIEHQTAELKKGIQVSGRVSGAPAEPAASPNTVSGGRKSGGTTKAAAGAAEAIEGSGENLEKRLSALTSDLSEIDGHISKLIQHIAATGNAELTAALEQARAARTKLAAEAAKLEREVTGVSRGDQSAARREAAKAEQGPLLSEKEHLRRLGVRDLIDRPASGDFLTSHRGGPPTKAMLRQILGAFGSPEIGMDVGKLPTRMSQEALAQRALDVRAKFDEIHQGTIPEALRTGRTTERISPEVRELLGALNHLASTVRERGAAVEALRSHGRAGGVFPSDAMSPHSRTGDERILAGVNRLMSGQAEGVILPPEQLMEHLNLLRQVPGESLMARQRAADPTFNPHSREYDKGISGASDEAHAHRLSLRALRKSTEELDQLSEDYELLDRAVRENKAFIKRATDRIGTDGEKPDDRMRLRQAQETIQPKLQQQMSQFLPTDVELFNDPGFLQGRQVRRAHRAEAAERALMHSNEQRASSEDIVQAGREAVVGIRTGVGTRNMTRNTPGLTYRNGRYTHVDGMENKAQARFDRLTNDLENSQRKAFKFRAQAQTEEGVDPERLHKANVQLEYAANAWSRFVDKTFGHAPGIQAHIGVDPTQPKVVGEEADRQARRDQLAANARRKFKLSPDEELAKLDEGVAAIQREKADAEEHLARITEQRAAAQARFEAEESTRLKALSKAERDLYKALRKQADEAETKSFRAGTKVARLGAEELPAHPDTIPHYLNPGVQGPRSAEQAVDDEKRARIAALKNDDSSNARIASDARQKMAEIAKVDKAVEAEFRQLSNLQAVAEREVAAFSGGQVRTIQRGQGGESARGSKQITGTLDQLQHAATTLRENIGSVRGLAATGANRKAIAEETGLKPSFIRAVLGPVKKKGEAAQEAASTQAAAATHKMTAEMNGTIAALKKEQSTLQTGPHTKADITGLREANTAAQAAIAPRKMGALQGQITKAEKAGNDERVKSLRARQESLKADAEAAQAALDAAKAAKQRLTAIRQELKGIGGGSGSGGGSKPPTGGGGGGVAGGGHGPEDNILRQILARLNGIHSTIKGGVKVTGGGGGGGTSASTSTGGAAAVGGGTPSKQKEIDEDKALLALAKERRKQQRLANARQYLANDDAKKERQTADETKKATQAKLDEAAATIRLAEATKLLSAATRTEIAELQALVQTGATAEQVIRKQASVYNSVQRDLGKQGITGGDRRFAATTVLTSGGGAKSQAHVDEIARTARAMNGFQAVDESMAKQVPQGGIFGEQSTFTKAMFGNHGFWSRVMASTGTFVVRNFTAGFVFGLTNALQDVISKAIETQSTFIKVSSALEATGRSVGSLRTDLQDVSTSYGIALTDVYETAAGLTGLFNDPKDIANATKVVSQLQLISRGALNAQEAMGTLASITSSFGELGNSAGLGHIADVLTVIQERVGVNIETTAEGVARLAGLAQQVGLTFEQTAVFVGEIAKKTNQTGAAAGEQFSRIVATLQTGRGRKALTDNLPKDSMIQGALDARQYGQAIEILMQRYSGLTKSQQDNIAVSLGGQRQAAAINALLSDGASVLDTVRAAQYAKGQADERSAQISKTLTAQLSILNQNFVNFAQNIVRSGIVSAFAGMLLGLNKVLGAVNHIFSVFNDITDSNSFTRFLKNVGAGLIGLVVTVGLVRRAMIGLKATVATLPGVEAGMAAMRGQTVAGPGGTVVARQSLGQRIGGRLQGAATTTVGSNASVGLGQWRNQLGPEVPYATQATSRLGKSLEAVSTGPLQKFGRGLESMGGAVFRSADSLRAQGPLTPGRFGTEGSVNRFNRVGSFLTSQGAQIGALGRGGEMILRGRGDLLASRASTSLSERASLLRSRADTMNTFNGGDVTRQERMTRAMAGSADLGAKSMSKLSTGLRAVSFSGAAAQGAMAGLSIAMTAMIMEMARQEQFAKDAKKAYDAVFGPDADKTAAQKAQEYVGPSTDLMNENRAGLGGVGGYMRALGSTYQNLFTKDSLNPLKGGFVGQYLTSIGSLGSQAAGDLPTDVSNSQTQAMVQAQKKMRTVYGGLGADAKATTEQVQKAQAEALAIVQKNLDDIENSDASAEQKNSAAAYAETVKKQIEALGQKAYLAAEGLGSINALTLDQVQRINNLMSTLTGASYGLPKDLQGIIGQQVDDLALNPDSQAAKLLARAQGQSPYAGSPRGIPFAENEGTPKPLTNAQKARLQRANIRNDIHALSASLETMSAGDDGYSEIEQQRDQLLSQYDALSGQILQGRTAHAQALMEFFAGRGTPARANRMLEGVVSQLRQKANDPAVSADTRLQLLNQANQLEQQQTQALITASTSDERLEQARTVNASRRAQLEVDIARKSLAIMQSRLVAGGATAEQVQALEIQLEQALQARAQLQVDQAQAGRQTQIAGISPGDTVAVTKAQLDSANKAVSENRQFGVTSVQYQQALQNQIQSQEAYNQAVASVTAAQSQLGEAYANARGDSVAAAKAAAHGGQLALAEAVRQAGGNMNAPSVIAAQATLVGLNAQIGQSQIDLIQSRYDVSIALATAAGHTVEAAKRTAAKAHKLLREALKKSGGENTAEVNQLRAQAIQADASVRDTKLQDSLDTIDFNLQMGKMTQSAAISALQQILRTQDLTKAQRRQLLLQIKGYKDSLSQGAWNFGDIKMPTPYQMRRYIEQNRKGMRQTGQRANAAFQDAYAQTRVGAGAGGGGSSSVTNHTTTTITINAGTDVRKVEEVVRRAVSEGSRTRTSQSRRR